MKQIFIINGIGKSGKDTFVNFIQTYLPNNKIHNLSSVSEIKKAAKLLGWNGEKTEESRLFLHKLKMISSEYNDFSFKYLTNYINNNEGIFFIHIREKKEILKLQNYFNNTKTILIKRNINIPNNDADKDVLNFKNYDFIIENNDSLVNFYNRIIEATKENISPYRINK